MSSFNKKLIILCTLNILFLLYGISTISISYQEALVFFEHKSLLSFISHIFTSIFGNNDYSLRAPFFIIHFINIFLLFKISSFYLKQKTDYIYLLAIYMLLPGINSATLILNEANLVIFTTLLFIYFFLKEYKLAYLVTLVISLFIDNAFLSLFIATILYGFKTKDKQLLYLSISLFIASYLYYGTGSQGKPQEFFVETWTLYSAVFSPFIFFYIIYILYRVLVKDKDKQDIMFYIAISAFVTSLVLSFRQKVYIEDFAPFLTISLPLVTQGFFKSYRIRLKQFRKNFNIMLNISIGFLMLVFLATCFNSIFYLLLEKPHRHFAYKQHFTKELAKKLKMMNIKQLNIIDEKLALKLKFYNISNNKSSHLKLSNKEFKESKSINFTKFNKVVKQYFITKTI